MKDETFLGRWSRRKRAATPGTVVPEAQAVPTQGVAPSPGAPSADAVAPAEPDPLPPVESLTPESDFAPFMRPRVDEDVKRQALKTLFSDPRFNVMDGLDVYIDDYSKPDPLPEGWLEKLNMVARLGEYREPEPAEGEGVADASPPPQQSSIASEKIEGEQALDLPAQSAPVDTSGTQPDAQPVKKFPQGT